MYLMSSITVRDYQPADAPALLDLFLRSIREIASVHYSPDQVAAWASAEIRVEDFATRREAKPTFVAMLKNEVAGFSDLEPDGHIDMLFVHPDHARAGVARALIDHVLDRAQSNGLERVFTEASITARPAFESFGFRVDAAQTVTTRGVSLVNFRMSRLLR